MASIIASDISVDLPILAGVDRSFKRSIATIGIGGNIIQTSTNSAVVQALRYVSLDIQNGDRTALIGRNGSGKTTLLRVLAGIAQPTTGELKINGEISTLFNPGSLMDSELTGYENIAYAGNMLGLTGGEIEKLIPDIEEFTELGDYLKMPIRTYSAGMLVRLSFGLITAKRSDILLLDEAIGAGDAHFMKKAENRALSFYNKSSILVMASHSNEVLRELCNKAIWLHAGRIRMKGTIDEVLSVYENTSF
ncbi:ATP-binding cassette domain-containing protein [Alphaproteobacteria bacterium]|nr:ATP-binding cassette domain-containing protein [Alphaproteobacteria bacterium]